LKPAIQQFDSKNTKIIHEKRNFLKRLKLF